jgi:signal peptidase I
MGRFVKLRELHFNSGWLAQLVRARRSHRRGHWFESSTVHQGNFMEETPTPEPNLNSHQTSAFMSGLLLVWDFLKIVIVALIIIIPVRFFVFQPFVVYGSSMEPNFENGQYLIIDELTFHFSDPVRGQAVVLRYPQDPKQYFIKRIIGLPGETVQIDNGRVTIYNAGNPNGVTIDESYLPTQGLTYPHDVSIVAGKKTLTLGSEEYFAMGDNRLASSDSRDWGVLERSEIIGKVFLRVLPLTEFELYNEVPAYNF